MKPKQELEAALEFWTATRLRLELREKVLEEKIKEGAVWAQEWLDETRESLLVVRDREQQWTRLLAGLKS